MIAEKMKNMVANSSAIRAMFEEGNRIVLLYDSDFFVTTPFFYKEYRAVAW